MNTIGQTFECNPGILRTFVGLRMTKPSFTSLRMFCLELALEISLIYWNG